MKKLFQIVIFLAAFMLLCIPALAEGEGFDAGVSIQLDGDTITVEVPESNDEILQAKKPTLTVPCPESWKNAEVSFEESILKSVFEDGKVSFTVAKSGTYTITKAEAVKTQDNDDDNDDNEPVTQPAGTVVADEEGNTLGAEVSISEEAAESGEIITLPIVVRAADDAEEAEEIKITLPEGAESVRIEIPVENLTPGTVAVIVREDGTEEIVKTSVNSADGVVLTLEGSATLKIIDNTKEFDDVPAGKWYADYVAWASSREIMIGTDKGFEPSLETSRGMVAQILFNLDGAEPGKITDAFTDVSEEDWYAASVSWMVDNGIAKGKGDRFGAEDHITREQVAVMLYNYAKYKGYDVSATDGLDAFDDAGDISAYAETAMRWAVGAGLINGMGDGTVNPQGYATRAQIAALMQRFCEKVIK